MSAAGSLVGRKRDRPAHSPAPKGLGGPKGSVKALERLAAAHTACSQLLGKQEYPESLSVLAHTLQRVFGAKLVALYDAAVGATAVAPAKAETRRWLEALRQRPLEGGESCFELDADDVRPPIAGIRRFVVVPLSTGRGRAALWLGFGDHGSSTPEELSILGEHLSLVLRRVASPSNGTRAASMPNGKIVSAIKPVPAQGSSDLISLAAHELRTPLTPITMLLQSLERKARAGAVDVETILRTRKQVARLTNMIGDLLDLSRLRDDRLVLTPVRVDLGRVAREAIVSFQEVDPRHRVEMRAESPTIEVMADEQRLHHMLGSLLEHVAHATPAGGIIEVMLHRRDRLAVVTIRADRPVFGFELVKSPVNSPGRSAGGESAVAPVHHPRPEPIALGVLLAEGIAASLGGSMSRAPSRSNETRVEVTFPLSTAD